MVLGGCTPPPPQGHLVTPWPIPKMVMIATLSVKVCNTHNINEINFNGYGYPNRAERRQGPGGGGDGGRRPLRPLRRAPWRLEEAHPPAVGQ